MSMTRVIILAALALFIGANASVAFATEEQKVAQGAVVIYDDQGLSDAVSYTLSNVEAPGDGKLMVGWLVSDDDGSQLSTGPMSVGSDGTVAHVFNHASPRYTGANLIQKYNRVVVTAEDSDVDEPAGSKIFEDVISGGVMSHIRHLLSDDPGGSAAGILTNLKDQLEVAIRHSDLAVKASTVDDVILHTKHVINVIEGSAGANFDANVANPGDGIGILKHAADRNHAGLAASGLPADDLVAVHAALVEIAAGNAEVSALAARDAAVSVAGESVLVNARLKAAPMKGHLQQALDGIDFNLDDVVSPAAGEGGAEQAYLQAQLMATYTLVAGAEAVPPVVVEPEPPASVGDPLVSILLGRIALIVSLGMLLTGSGLLMLGRFRHQRM